MKNRDQLILQMEHLQKFVRHGNKETIFWLSCLEWILYYYPYPKIIKSFYEIHKNYPFDLECKMWINALKWFLEID